LKLIRRCIPLVFIAVAALAAAQQIEITNPLDLDRKPEVVVLPLSRVLQAAHLTETQASKLIAVDTASGKLLPTQLYSSRGNATPDTLLLLVEVSARQKLRINLKADATAPRQEPLVYGRAVPERKDDFAWENQLVTYRIYGPALQATGEVTSGVDVWSKRIPNFIINDFYQRDAKGSSYHKDNGIGLDSYEVGPTPGCGGTAVYSGEKLIPSKNYTHVSILANGPIRFAFEVSYAPWDAEGVSVAETKRIILDAGTHLNQIESTFHWEGKQALRFSAGVTVHKGAEASVPKANTITAVWDTPQDATAGHIATGLLALPQQHAQSVSIPGKNLLVFERHSDEPFLYYAGSAWSKSDMPTLEAWSHYLKIELQMLEHPLRTRWTHP